MKKVFQFHCYIISSDADTILTNYETKTYNLELTFSPFSFWTYDARKVAEMDSSTSVGGSVEVKVDPSLRL